MCSIILLSRFVICLEGDITFILLILFIVSSALMCGIKIYLTWCWIKMLYLQLFSCEFGAVTSKQSCFPVLDEKNGIFSRMAEENPIQNLLLGFFSAFSSQNLGAFPVVSGVSPLFPSKLIFWFLSIGWFFPSLFGEVRYQSHTCQ